MVALLFLGLASASGAHAQQPTALRSLHPRSKNEMINSLADGPTTTNAPASGLFDCTDNFSDLGAPPPYAFYRLSWAP